MSTEWAVVPADDQFTLDARNTGEMTFTVSNPGAVADTVVFDVLPGAGVQRSWFSIEEPQRRVNPQEAAAFQVKVAVPAGTPAQRYDVTGLAYSASTAPEESSRTSGRVSLEVGVSKKPKKKPWPILIAAIVLVLAVAGVVTFLVWPDGSSIPDLRGTYRGTTIDPAGNSVSHVVLVVDQDGSRLTATIKDLAFPDSNFIGSGTATADGFVTLRFDIEGPATFDGSTPSPGRLKGIWKYDDNSSSGTWDVCTCVS